MLDTCNAHKPAQHQGTAQHSNRAHMTRYCTEVCAHAWMQQASRGCFNCCLTDRWFKKAALSIKNDVTRVCKGLSSSCCHVALAQCQPVSLGLSTTTAEFQRTCDSSHDHGCNKNGCRTLTDSQRIQTIGVRMW
jgi:hypothetical protein